MGLKLIGTHYLPANAHDGNQLGGNIDTTKEYNRNFSRC
jgi:hypothetical protein